MSNWRSAPRSTAARTLARPIGWAYGRLRFTRPVHRRCYLPTPIAVAIFGEMLTMDVALSRITHRVPYPFREAQRDVSPRFVWQGDWDVEAEVLDDDPRFIDMKELAAASSYRSTRSYRRMTAAAAAGQPEVRQRVTLRSPWDIDEYFENKLRLLAGLRADGYRSQRQLGLHGDEIGIAIGRKGELLKYFHGHHRIALAKALALERVTVRVEMVHHGWIERCCAASNDTPVAAVRAALADLAT